jgi:hypothetical protein
MIERQRIERQRRPDGPLVEGYSACAALISSMQSSPLSLFSSTELAL